MRSISYIIYVFWDFLVYIILSLGPIIINRSYRFLVSFPSLSLPSGSVHLTAHFTYGTEARDRDGKDPTAQTAYDSGTCKIIID